MEFRIADTFTDSLLRLTAQEQKAVKTTAFDLQLNPASPGMKFHKIDRAKDPNFWSVRVNADVRLIVHKSASSLLLVYADHHDDAYKWAERRKIERHPTTGGRGGVRRRPAGCLSAAGKQEPGTGGHRSSQQSAASDIAVRVGSVDHGRGRASTSRTAPGRAATGW